VTAGHFYPHGIAYVLPQAAAAGGEEDTGGGPGANTGGGSGASEAAHMLDERVLNASFHTLAPGGDLFMSILIYSISVSYICGYMHIRVYVYTHMYL